MRQILLGLFLLPSALVSASSFGSPFWHLPIAPTLADTIPPVITCPPSVTIDAPNGTCQVIHFYTVTATDDQPGVFSFQVTGLPSGEAFPVGATVNSFAAADLAGNTATCSFRVTVKSASTSGLICKSDLTVTLGADCSTTLLASSLLEPPFGCPANYMIEFDKTAPFGNGPWVTGPLTSADLGKTYQYRVTALDSGSKCWGNVKAIDGTPPAMTCPTLTLSCVVSNYTPAYLKDSLGLAGWTATVLDACGSTSNINFVDSETPAPCDSAFYKVINRRWTATDPSGNSATCIQRITAQRVQPADVKFPSDATLSCPKPNTAPAATGEPFITWNGKNYPLNGAGACTFGATFLDSMEQVCGGGRLIRRAWSVVNFCSGGILRDTQLIHIQDSVGPALHCPTAPILTTTATDCKGAVNLPDVVITDACSQLTDVRVYWTADGSLDSLVGELVNFAANDPLKLDTLGRIGVDSLFPVGQTILYYEATDACGNKGSCTALLEVWDQTPPEAKCDSTIQVVMLNAEGAGEVNAVQLNFGSSDLCTPVIFKAKRQLGSVCQPLALFDDMVPVCCEDIGDTVQITLRAYDVSLPTGGVLATFAAGHFSECTARVVVTDVLPPRCVAPPDVTTTCKNFDPTLTEYGNLVSKTCRVDSVVVALDSSMFNGACKTGALTRHFRTFDVTGKPGSSCTQRITVTPEQDYFIRFPDDRVVTACDGTNTWGEPTFSGIDCEQMNVTFTDEVITVVPDACYRIDRTWKVWNKCSHNPNQPLTVVPNPQPNTIANHATNLPGPVVSSSGDPGKVPAPWTATRVNISPINPQTDYSVFYNGGSYVLNAQTITVPPIGLSNGFSYKQSIKVLDSQKPTAPSCPSADIHIGDPSDNDNLLWNETYWSDQGNNDMREAPANLSVTASDACAGPNLDIQYLLYLDLDNNGTRETVVSSKNLPAPGIVNFNNSGSPNFIGGIARTFDKRPVADNLKYRFAVQTFQSGNQRTARVVWNTMSNPQSATMPQLPYGQHRIKWTIMDACGNETTCEHGFTVSNSPLPTMSCDTSFQLSITPQNSVSLPLSVVLPPILDHIQPNPAVQFGIRKSGTGSGFPSNSTALSFGCAEIGNHMVEVWARDPDGRTSNCSLPVNIVDPANNCSNSVPKEIAGRVVSDQGKGVGQVSVKLQSPALTSTPTVITDTSGHFFYNATVPLGSGYELIPSKDIAPLNGVSTFDLVVISKHILGIESLPNPYLIIAADGNRSGSVTTFDIVEFRKLILGIYVKMPNCPSWRFVPKNFVFPDPLNPFKTVFPEIISVPAIFGDSLTQDFVGIKVGDMNRSVLLSAAMASEDRGGSPLFFDVENRFVRPGEEFSLTLRPAEPNEGCQFTLEHPSLELLDLQPGPGLSTEHFALFDQALTAACETSNSTGFTATFRATQSGYLSEMLHFSDRITRSEAYLGQVLAVAPLALRFGQNTTAPVPFGLYQNHPNPFSESTSIGFSLPEASAATLSIYDQTGRSIYSKSATWSKGHHTIGIEKNDLQASGVLYYRLETATHSAVRKMVRGE